MWQGEKVKKASIIAISVLVGASIGFTVGALVAHGKKYRQCEQALITSCVGHTDTLLSALKRIRQQRADDASALLEQSLEGNQIVLRGFVRADGSTPEIVKILSRIEEYEKGRTNTAR